MDNKPTWNRPRVKIFGNRHKRKTNQNLDNAPKHRSSRLAIISGLEKEMD
jgi:hypothetical protein